MKDLGGMLTDVYATLLSPVSQCCASIAGCMTRDNPGQSYSEKRSMAVLRDEPTPTYITAPNYSYHNGWQHRARASKDEGKDSGASLPVRKRFAFFRNQKTWRRPHISAPTNFRHLYSDSFQDTHYKNFQNHQRWPSSTIRLVGHKDYDYISEKPLPLMLPHCNMSSIALPPPTFARPTECHVDDSSVTPGREFDSMSFHIPRKLTESLQTSIDDSPPRIPPKSRARAYTSPNVDEMKERIASALNEVDRLQREIDLVIERQSIYAASRPSSARSLAQASVSRITLYSANRTSTAIDCSGMEPMPSIPALPPAAPSFSERLGPAGTHCIDRPYTAPSNMPVHIPTRAKTFAEASAAFITPPPSREREETPLPPPLPLVLRPPLRKKKSFSRVSNWLFPGGGAGHQRGLSLESITNLPRPVKGREGFYQCVAPSDPFAATRHSFESTSTVPTSDTDDNQTAPTTTWSPSSTPVIKSQQAPLEQVTAFGKQQGPDVGLAI